MDPHKARDLTADIFKYGELRIKADRLKQDRAAHPNAAMLMQQRVAAAMRDIRRRLGLQETH